MNHWAGSPNVIHRVQGRREFKAHREVREQLRSYFYANSVGGESELFTKPETNYWLQPPPLFRHPLGVFSLI